VEVSLRVPRLASYTLAVVLVIAAAPAQAASKHGSSGQGTGPLFGFAAGALLPQGDFADTNATSYFIQSRSLYVEKVFGGRAAAYYGDTDGANGTDGGRVYGFDFDVLLKFGSADTFGYVYAGAGYGSLTFTYPGAVPGTTVRHGGYDWCWTGGIGLTIKRGFYLEAGYVSYQTDPVAADFIPVVIGFQF
jgi:hypothetical protein